MISNDNNSLCLLEESDKGSFLIKYCLNGELYGAGA